MNKPPFCMDKSFEESIVNKNQQQLLKLMQNQKSKLRKRRRYFSYQHIYINMFKLSIIIVSTLLLIGTYPNTINYPISFTVVRNINLPLNMQQFFQRTGCCKSDPSTNITNSYNLVSLDGFSSSSTLTTIRTSSSPLSVWLNAFAAITAMKDTIAGNNVANVQKYILNIYHQASSLLIFNAFSNEAPISQLNVSPSTLAQSIAGVLEGTQLDGVSIEFGDYHAVAKGTASEWLSTLLSNLKKRIGNKIIVLIIPPTFVLRIQLLQQPLINSYVDFFVLKYFDTNQADYNSYQTLFWKSNSYPGTALMQLISNKQVWIDTCKTIIAKPVSNFGRLSRNFMDSGTLRQAYLQINSNTSWFGGFANLDFESDPTLSFQENILQDIRSLCYSSSNCVCK